MLDDERISSFICSLDNLDKYKSDVLKKIEDEALKTEVPIIRTETQMLIRFLIKAFNPDKILEVGTAVGFSSIFMWEMSDKNTKITTIENYDKRIPIARDNFGRAGAEGSIEMIEGDAGEVLSKLNGSYPFIFMDGPKGQYINYLPDIDRLLTSGGILLTDNVLRDGDVCESRYAVTRRNRTIHTRMREYLYELTHREDFETVILNNGDGVAISYKK